MTDTPLTSRIIDLMNTKGLKEETMKVLRHDRDFKKVIVWFLLGLIAMIGTLFLNPFISLAIGLLLTSNALLLSSIVTGKLLSIVTILNKVKEESEVISYNKSLTDAINLLFHNRLELRERGKDIILRDYPEHSEIILSSERIMLDSSEDDDDLTPSSKPSARIN